MTAVRATTRAVGKRASQMVTPLVLLRLLNTRDAAVSTHVCEISTTSCQLFVWWVLTANGWPYHRYASLPQVEEKDAFQFDYGRVRSRSDSQTVTDYGCNAHIRHPA